MTNIFQPAKCTFFLRAACIICLALCMIQPALAKTPRILTSIKPLHSLVSSLILGITEVELLLDSSQTPHDFQLRPSDRRKIARADMIIYISDGIETYMADIRNSLHPEQRVYQLINIPGIHTLPARAAEHHDHHDHDMDIDGHIWLSLANARAIVEYIYTQLVVYDPEHQALYLANKQRLLKQLSALQASIHQQLSSVRDKHYLTYHDAFQYFETEFQLTGAHFVTTNPEYFSSVKNIQHHKQLIEQKNIQCVYYEPPRPPRILRSLKQDHPQLRLRPLDPIGAEISAGDNLYPDLITTITRQLVDCLQ